MGESLERPFPKSIGEPLEYIANHTGLALTGISAIAVIIGSGSKISVSGTLRLCQNKFYTITTMVVNGDCTQVGAPSSNELHIGRWATFLRTTMDGLY